MSEASQQPSKFIFYTFSIIVQIYLQHSLPILYYFLIFLTGTKKNNLKKPLWELFSFHGKYSSFRLSFFLHLTEKNVPIYYFINQHYFHSFFYSIFNIKYVLDVFQKHFFNSIVLTGHCRISI